MSGGGEVSGKEALGEWPFLGKGEERVASEVGRGGRGLDGAMFALGEEAKGDLPSEPEGGPKEATGMQLERRRYSVVWPRATHEPRIAIS